MRNLKRLIAAIITIALFAAGGFVGSAQAQTINGVHIKQGTPTHPATTIVNPGTMKKYKQTHKVPLAVAAYQHEGVGLFFGQPTATNQGLFNLQAAGYYVTSYGTQSPYGTTVRRGNDDVEYGYLIGMFPYYQQDGWCITDRISIRVLGPDNAMSIYAITDWGVAWRASCP